MKHSLIVAAMLYLGTAHAFGWPVEECTPEKATAWADYERSVRTAAPGSPLYLPKPFPRNRDDVIADYLYQYRNIWGDTPIDQVPSDESPVLESVLGKTARFEIVPVENWTTTRCNREQRDASYRLIRIFSVSGVELARTALSESGFILVTANATDAQRAEPAAAQKGRLMKLADAIAKASSEFNVNGSDPQYVATFGTLRCRPFAPCVAFQSGPDSYILSPEGELFRLAANARRLSLKKDLKTPADKNAALQSLRPDERLVSLGGASFGVVQRVRQRSAE